MTQPCHYDHDLDTRVTARHRRGCERPGCPGCEPCTEAHCTMPRCSHHLEDHETYVCARCVGRVRAALTRLYELMMWAPVVATASRGVNSREVDLAGYVADVTTYGYRRRWVLLGRLCRCSPVCPDQQPIPAGPECKDWRDCKHHTCRRRTGRPTCPELVAWLDHADDDHHPLWVLGYWATQVAEHLGHQLTTRVTVTTAATYLTRNLTDLARDPDFDFDQLARETRDCLAHVEDVLQVAEREQRGAPCPVCHAAGRKAKPLVREYADDQPDDRHDLWVCTTPVCAQTWKVDEYQRFVAGEYLDRADRLTARQIAAKYRVSEGSIRGWASLGKVRRRGRDQQGLTLYDVNDVLAQRDRTQHGATA